MNQHEEHPVRMEPDQPGGVTPPLLLGDLALSPGWAASQGRFIVCLAPPYCRCSSPYSLYHHLSPEWYDSPCSRIAREKAMFIGSTSHEDLMRDLALLWEIDLTQGWHLLDGEWRATGCRCDPEDGSPIPPRARIAFYTSPPPPPVPLVLPDVPAQEEGSAPG